MGNSTPSTLFRYWSESLSLFAVPLALLFLSFAKSATVRFLHMAWGLWIVGLTFVLFFSKGALPETRNFFFTIFFSAVFVVAMGMALATLSWKPRTS